MKNTPREWDLIQKIKNRVQRNSPQGVVPLGDDAFVFKNFPGFSVICQDMMVEDVHFSLDYFTTQDLAYKALAVNLSDIAAMGARPHFVQVSLALPKKINSTDTWLDDFYQGMTALADEFSCEVVGGDLVGGASFKFDKIVIDVSVYGSCEHPFTRRGAQPGDFLLCSGPLGLSQTGLRALQKKIPGFDSAKSKHLRPHPQVQKGLDLTAKTRGALDKVHALMDCSDGLVNDGLILAQNRLNLEIFADQLPLHEETLNWSESQGENPLDYALWGGEDFELLLAIAPEDCGLFPEWYKVGQFTAAESTSSIFLVQEMGQKTELKEFKGWAHF